MKAAIILMMIMSFPSWGTVSIGVEDCPTQFEGRVKEIIEPVGSAEVFSSNRVVFENQRTIKGEVGGKVLLDILQNGPFQVETHKDYRVKLRNGKLCWIEEI